MTSLHLPGALSRTLPFAIAGIVLSAVSICDATAQSLKSGDLAPFEVVYEVGNNLINAGDARLVLSNKANLWTYSLKIQPRGVFKLAGKGRISEQSTFTLAGSDDNVQLQPQSYSYRQDDERRRQVDASFDWANNAVTHKYRGKTVTETFDEPLLDRLTATLLIMNTLRHDFQKVELPIFDSAKIKQVEFVNEGHETLQTRLGTIDTIRVTNHNAIGGSRQTITWFAPSLDYLPVKIEHKKRDELVVRLSLLSFENRVTSLELGGALPVEDSSADEEAEEVEVADEKVELEEILEVVVPDPVTETEPAKSE
ncbi:DUF3108 domain-containing protein [Granulosicoccus antarcticus]|uniref:DUF3108 domain-containing protein n=1 Tax=Granulosicoccus antarcticus IMCC3135 TaxID=1192854 RepID=A0A2Z2NXU5_9GAMM|nr:DUF3108 domain-containing protein [Granulosicoccus antarcticus]ASJ76093.1 hypothetical protein IMCC3135_30220 [Granulosicoccus antarcticus IMCC3135]